MLSPEILTRLSSHLQGVKRPLLAILGPTAGGKTDLSLDVAEWIAKTKVEHGWEGAEILNADSRQLYRGLDIGTAKISAEEMRGIPHHLIDVLDPSQEVTVARYKEWAEKCIEEILARKHVPILVGGSMLYVSAIIDGLEPLSPVDPALRKKLEEEYDRDQGAALYKRLQEADPQAAAAFHPNNKPYVVRAMEIYEATGAAPSKQKRMNAVPYDLFLLGIRWPREQLVERINLRTKKLMGCGWVEEVAVLIQAGYGPDAPAMKSHGYREIMEALLAVRSADGTWTGEAIEGVKRDEKLREMIAINTRRYAKRQMTWWGHDERIHWIDRE